MRSKVASWRSALEPSSQDAVGVLHLLAAAQFVHHVVDEPLDQLADQVAGRQFLLLAEVDQLAVQTVADRSPLVLLDQVEWVDAEGHVVAAQLPHLGDDRLEDGRHDDTASSTRVQTSQMRNSSVG